MRTGALRSRSVRQNFSNPGNPNESEPNRDLMRALLLPLILAVGCAHAPPKVVHTTSETGTFREVELDEAQKYLDDLEKAYADYANIVNAALLVKATEAHRTGGVAPPSLFACQFTAGHLD